MTAPAKSFTVIADTAVDVDSPLDEALVTALRDNTLHLEEWLGKDYTAAQNHRHDGIDSFLLSGAVLLDDQTVSGVTSVIVNGKFSASYQRYVWWLQDVEAPTSNSNVSLTVSTDGSTYSSTGYYQGSPNSDMGAATSAFELASAGTTLSGNTDVPMAGEIHLFHPLGTAYKKQFRWEFNYLRHTADQYTSTDQAGLWLTTSAYVAAKISMGGNTFDGRFRLYGIGGSG